MINRQTYEEYFLLYIDGELDAAQRAEVEQFIGENPGLKTELDMLGQSVFVADDNIVFENKDVLYRKEKKAAILFFNRAAFLRVSAAAAILILLATGGWLYFTNKAPVVRQPAKQLAATNNQQSVDQQNIPTEKAPSVRPPATPEATSARDNGQEKTGMTQTGIADRTLHQKKHHAINRTEHPEKELRSDAAHNEDVVAETDAADIGLKHDPVVMNDVAMTDYPDDGINIPVKARSIPAPGMVGGQDNIRYAAEDDLSDNSRIYFANTSISRRNSLRVVFRKASRIIDRITTLQ